jgi:uncharacterized protein
MAAAAVCAAALWLAGSAHAAEGDAAIPAAQGYVTDVAGVIGETRQAQLESHLAQLKEKTGVQFAVLTVNSTAPEAPEQYKVRVVQEWHLGGEKQDEIVLLLLAMQERRLVFETGYGLEGTLTDVWEAGMLRDLVRPRFRAGEIEDGMTLAVLQTVKRIADAKGVSVPWTGDALRYDERPARQRRGLPPILVAFLVFMILSAILNRFGGPRGGFRGGPYIGGFGGWGGGFGGGSGGGSSFGGFGGGGGGSSSGGGGGGMSW